MARRTDRRAESRHRPVSSTETGVTTPGGKHGPASSTESRDTKGAASMAVPKPGTASMAVPKHGAASKARPHPSVRIQYGSSKNTTPPTGPEHSRRASQPPPGVNSEHYPQVSRFQYGLNDTTPAPPVGPKPSRRSTEQRRGRAPSDPYLTDDSRRRHGKPGSEWGEAAETGSTAAPDHRDRPAESAKVGDRHHRKADPDSDEAFLAAAASARLARLKYESNKNRPAGTLDAGPPIGTSAAERVRTILGPGAPAARKTTKGGLAPAEAAASRGDERNAKRLREANAVDRETLGESPSVSRSFATDHLPGDAALFFPAPAAGPCDEFAPPAWFWAAIQEVCATTSEVPTRSPIRFEMTDEASTHNADILRAVDFDLGRLIQGHGSSTLGFGSEFRKLSELRPLIGRHPHFPRLESLLTEGMHYVFDRELSHDERMVEMIAMLARGNHKSAQVEQDRVGELLAKDVVHGFTIPLPISIVKSIPGAMIQPLGLVQQWTVGDDGERKAKFRLTQDLSFSTDRKIPPTSINKRVDMSAYVEMVYGWCLPRIVHFIVALRSQNPWLLILISKYDYSDAYRRIAHSAAAATQTIAINGATAFLSLRLTFGGSPNPPTWCMFSELVTDLANEIAQCDEWDPNECRSPAQPDTPEPLRLPAGIPIVQARRMALHIPPTKAGGRVDGFIDDLINVFLDTPSNCARQPHIVPLAMHLTSRPHAGDEEEPLPRRPILSIPKLIAEGRPEEIQIVLGWRLNTRLLEISLPDDKYLAWSTDVRKLRAAGHCGVKDMETLVGRLNHTAYIIPNARHFMSRIRRGLETRGGGNRSRKVGAEALEDLLLWEEFLEHANKGVSMNLLVTREPNKICWSDACPYGLGGYSLSGRAWRLLIPRASPIFGHQGINNLLEFVGMAINIWLACLESAGGEHCILAIGDNTSAIGWLHNSSRLDTSWDAHTAHLQVARKIATLLIDFRCCLASQHLKGELNVVADLLSFAGDDSRGKSHPIAADMPANDELTCRFLSSFPSQVPANFAISQLPDEILSWTTQVLRAAESYLTDDKKAAMSRTTEHGAGGMDTALTSGTVLTPSSLCYPSTSGTSSSGRSSTSTGTPSGTPGADLREIVANQWSRVLCEKPQATWLRRFGAISGSAPCTSRDRRTCDHPSGLGSRPATTSTPRNENKKQRRPSSCEQCSNSRELGQNPQRTHVNRSSPRSPSQPTSSQ